MTAEALLELAFDAVAEGVTKRKSAFHTFTLGTVDGEVPQLRTMVLRGFDASRWTVRTNTDVRSPKWSQLSGPASVLFYGAKEMLQIRALGQALLHHADDVALAVWNAMPLLSRRCYLAPHPPSTASEEWNANLAPGLEDREPTEEESRSGFQNFGVIRIQLTEIEVYKLAYHGNFRARFERSNDVVTCTWLTS